MIKTKDTYASKLYIFLFFLKNFTFRIFFKNFDFFFNFFETFFNFKFFVTSVEKGWGYVPIWEMGGVYPYMGVPQVFGVHKIDHSLLLEHFLFVVSNNLLISGVVLGH